MQNAPFFRATIAIISLPWWRWQCQPNNLQLPWCTPDPCQNILASPKPRWNPSMQICLWNQQDYHQQWPVLHIWATKQIHDVPRQPTLAQKPTRWWLLHNGKGCLPTWNDWHQLESSTMIPSLPECNNNLRSCQQFWHSPSQLGCKTRLLPQQCSTVLPPVPPTKADPLAQPGASLSRHSNEPTQPEPPTPWQMLPIHLMPWVYHIFPPP